jgi:hypothetical protein
MTDLIESLRDLAFNFPFHMKTCECVCVSE